MKELTKAENQVMQLLWAKKHAFVRELVEAFDPPRPAYNTVSTIIRILETKGFVAHEVFGNSHRYFPVVSKDAYRKFSANRVVGNYFNGSPSELLSFFIKEKRLDAQELDELMEILEKAKTKRPNNDG